MILIRRILFILVSGTRKHRVDQEKKMEL